jgi:hypothetical protein
MGRFSKVDTTVHLDRIQKQHMENVKRDMPKLWFVEDSANGGYRVGRTDWAGDAFEIISKAEFDSFLNIYKRLSMPVFDLTNDDDGQEWEKIRT